LNVVEAGLLLKSCTTVRSWEPFIRQAGQRHDAKLGTPGWFESWPNLALVRMPLSLTWHIVQSM